MYRFLVLLLAASSCLAEPPPVSLEKPQQKQALAWLCSQDPAVRRRAHQALNQLGEGDRELHLELLRQAQNHHQQALERVVRSIYQEGKATINALDDWETACEQTLTTGRRDLNNDRRQHRQLSRQIESLGSQYRRLTRTLPPLASRVEACLSQTGAVLEFARERLHLTEREEALGTLSSIHMLQATSAGEHLLDWREALARFQSLKHGHAQAHEFNRTQVDWAKDSQQAFAEQLNVRREILGLSPLFLSQALCEAAAAHSQEMIQLGYFNHTSPTAERRTPTLRSQRAGYAGHFQGENIYMGNRSPKAAFEAWWMSDGHRKLLLADRASDLGIAKVQTHWTMLLGRGPLPKAGAQTPPSTERL